MTWFTWKDPGQRPVRANFCQCFVVSFAFAPNIWWSQIDDLRWSLMSDCHGLNSLNGSDTPAAQASISSRCQCTPLATQTLSLCLAERVPWKSLKWDPWQRQMWTLTIPSLCLWRLGNLSEALMHLKGLISSQLAGAGYSKFSNFTPPDGVWQIAVQSSFRGVVHPSTTLGLWDGACNELLSWFFTTIAMGWYAGDRAKYLGFGHEPQQSGLCQETWKQNEMETWEKMVIIFNYITCKYIYIYVVTRSVWTASQWWRVNNRYSFIMDSE